MHRRAHAARLGRDDSGHRSHPGAGRSWADRRPYLTDPSRRGELVHDPNPSLSWNASPGVAGYSYLIDQTATTIPPATITRSALRFAPSTLPAGLQPEGIASDDLNGDGKADLVVSDYAAGTISVLLGGGDGSFQSAVDYPVGAGPYGFATADLNGDGNTDVVVAEWSNAHISVLLGNGDGTLRPAVGYAVGAEPSQIVVGDFNGDGTLDLAVSTYAVSAVSVLLGNGDGTFQAAKRYPTAANAEALAVGDLNADGTPDLAVVDWTANVVSILMGNGDGTFESHVDYPVGQHPHCVVVGDFNGDGALDLAAANWLDGTVSVLLGHGDGTFGGAVTYGVGASPARLAVADFNGDGLPDLAVADRESANAGVLLGKGDGTFMALQAFTTPAHPHAIVAADFNGDGVPDLAVACNTTGGTSVGLLLNTTMTPLAAAYSHLANGVWYFHVCSLDTEGTPGPTATRAIRIDTTSPTISVSGNDSTWHTTTVTLTFTPTVGPSGVASVQYRVGSGVWSAVSPSGGLYSAVISADGANTVSYRVTDNAGTTSAVGSCTVKIDSSTPTVTVSGNDNAWHDGPMTLTFTPTVGPSGVASVQYRVGSGGWSAVTPSGGLYSAVISADGANTVSYRVTDNAGTTSAVGSCTVKIDTLPPTVSASGAGDGAWLNHAVTISLSAADNPGSGVASITYSLDGVTETVVGGSTQVVIPASPNAAHTLSYSATDHAGNVSAGHSLSVRIDTIGPTTLPKAAKGHTGKAIALRYLVRDNLSPQATAVTLTVRNSHGKFVKRFALGTKTISTSYTVRWTPRASGTYRYTVTAKDLAGNQQASAGSAKITVR